MADEGKGCFLFISHSHKDMDKVRQIRNTLEDFDFEPLCFYLKALDDSEEELDDLIKREIDARQWFICAVSANSRESEWVQKECEWRMRKESENRQIWEIDLESESSIDDILKDLIRGLRVNVIYSHSDIAFVNRLRDKLIEKDLQVTLSNGKLSKEDCTEQMMGRIDKASEYGTNVVIISRNSVKSHFVLQKLSYAIERDSLLVPVVIDDVELGIDPLTPTRYIVNEDSDEDLDIFVEKVVGEIRRTLDRHFKR